MRESGLHLGAAILLLGGLGLLLLLLLLPEALLVAALMDIRGFAHTRFIRPCLVGNQGWKDVEFTL